MTSARADESPTWATALQAGAFPLLAALAGVAAAVGGLLLCLGVAVLGWFLADAGGHGDTRDAMRVGADVWLVGHGSALDFGGVRYSVVPLGLTLLLALFVHRTVRAAARTLPPADDRETGLGIALVATGYVSTAVVAAVLAGTDAAHVPLLRAVVGAAVMSVVVGGAAVLGESGRWSLVTSRVPGGTDGPAPALVAAAARVAGWSVVASLAVVLGSLAVHASTVREMLAAAVPPEAAGVSGAPGTMDTVGDLTAIGLLSVLLLPNAALLAAGYLVGPGFAVGTGTTVSATAVSLGPVPALPLLGALPAPTGDQGEPWPLMLVWSIPVIVAAAAVIWTIRRSGSAGVTEAELGSRLDARSGPRLGALAGVAGGILLGALTGLGGGSLGSGRMADIGTTVWEVVLFAAVSCGVGGVLGGLLARRVNHLLDRAQVRRAARRAERAAGVEEAAPAVAARIRHHEEETAGAARRSALHDHTRHHPSDGRPAVAAPATSAAATAAGTRSAAQEPDEDSLSATDLLAAFTHQTSTAGLTETEGDHWTEWAGDWSDEPTTPLQR